MVQKIAKFVTSICAKIMETNVSYAQIILTKTINHFPYFPILAWLVINVQIPCLTKILRPTIAL
jgi:hypothetical protein